MATREPRLAAASLTVGALGSALAGVWLLSTGAVAAGQQRQLSSDEPCPRCRWTAPVTKATTRVRSTAQLYSAVSSARQGTTILLEPGEYRLDHTLDLSTPGIVVRGVANDPTKVTLRGAGMDERAVGVAVSVNAPDVTIADLTIGMVGYHGIQVRGEAGASRVTIHDVRIVNTGQQLVKGSTDGGSKHADGGLVACSTFEYTDHAPSDYTNGVDVIAGNDWTVRDNTFRRIRGPAERAWAAGPTILFWGNAAGTRVERNTIIDSYRGIAFGLGPGASQTLARDGERQIDHRGGWIRNNVVVNLNRWADEGIEVNAGTDAAIDHNTVMTLGSLDWSISLRFPQTTAWARNNLTSKAIILRDGGRGERGGNVTGATTDWFVDIATGNARLAGAHAEPIDAGTPIGDVPLDAAGQRRVVGAGPDAGAFEFRDRP